MTLTKYVGILASGLALTGAASAQGTDAMSEIAQLKAEVATLKSQNGDKWLTEERAAEIKSLVKDVLADSETRTSLQGSGATSGYNNGFFISSADGNFKLNLSLLAQARFTWNYQPGENIAVETVPPAAPSTFNGTGDGVSTWAFENRRTQMAFSGNVVDPSWTYMARLNYGSTIDPYTPEAGAVVLQDAWVNKDFGNGVGLKVGQFKSPFMAESLRNDGAQLTAERSTIDYIFSGGYTQGIMLNYTQDMFRAMGSYNNGPRAQNGTWSTNSNNSISLAGRVEFKAMGSWSQFDTESSLKSDESGLVIGAAIQYYNNRGASAGGAQYNPSVASIIYGGDGSSTLPTDQVTTTGAVVLQDAWVNKDFGNGVGLKVGQFKSPFMAESLRNDGAQLTAERSTVDYIFSGGYTQGIMLNYTQDMFRAMGSYNNGPRGQNGTWTPRAENSPENMGNVNSISLAGRVEFKAMGSWSQFDTESSLKSDESGLVIGAAIQYYNNRGLNADGDAQYAPVVVSPVYGTLWPDSTTTGAIDWTVDAAFKSGGMSLSAAFVGANGSYTGSSADSVWPANDGTYSSYGMVVQGGYRFTDSLEAFGRWEWMNVQNAAATPGGDNGDATDVNNILTFGVNVYAGINMKWTTQFGISLSDIGNSEEFSQTELNGAGWQPDANTSNSDQMNVISQLQIMF